MIKLKDPSDWLLDDNGINIVDEQGNSIIDLRNEFFIKDISYADNLLVVNFIKDRTFDLKRDAVIDNLELKFYGFDSIDMAVLKSEDSIFEGIYEFEPESLSLCIGDTCYLIRGKQVSMGLSTRSLKE